MSTFLDRLLGGVVAVAIAGTQIATRPTVNIVSGATAVDNPGTNSVDVTISGGGGGGGVTSVNAATGALTVAQGSGISVTTVGTTITIAQGTASGDWTGAITANTVNRIKGATVSSSAGSLTVGKVLRVTGGSTLDYGAVDLANSNAVTGNLPVTNIAPSGTSTWVLTTTAGVVGWAAPSGGGGGAPTGTGIPHITSGTQDGAAIHGTADQLFGANHAGTDAVFFTLTGDASIASGAVTVAKINGTSVPAGGSLTTGNAAYVSGASAATYSALNLAGGSGWVTGLLPIANLATPNFGSQTITTTGATNTGSLRVTGLTGGVGHLDGSGNLTSALVTSADIDSSVASTSYVDTKVQGLSTKASVVAATAAALPTVTYSNGSSGVGATLTAAVAGAITIDGQAVVLNSRYLIKDQVATLQNGIYTCTTLGTGIVAAIFTRATDYDQAAEMPGGYVFVEDGSTNNASGWTMSVDAITVGTTGIVWTQFSGAGEITVVGPLSKSGNQISIANIADASISATAAIAGTKISPSFGSQTIDSTAATAVTVNALSALAYSTTNLDVGRGFAITRIGFTGGEVVRVENGGVALFTTGSSGSYGSGVGVLSVKDATTAASTNPTSGFVHWSASGRPNWRTADGDVWLMTVQSDTLTGTSVTSQAQLQHKGNFGIFAAPSAAGTNVSGAVLDIGGGLGTGSAGGGFRVWVNTPKGSGSTAQDSHTLAIYGVASGTTNAFVAINSGGTTPDVALHVFGQVQATLQCRGKQFAALVGDAFAFDSFSFSAAMSSQPTLTAGSSGTASQIEQPSIVCTSVMSANGGFVLPLKAGATYWIYNGTTNTATSAAWTFTVGGATGRSVYCPNNCWTQVMCDNAAANYDVVGGGGFVVQYTLSYGSAQIGNVAEFKVPLGFKIVGATVRVVTTQVGGTITVDAGTTSAGVDIIANHTPGAANTEVAHTGTGLLGGAEILCNATTVFFGIHGSGSTSTVGSLVFSVRVVPD